MKTVPTNAEIEAMRVPEQELPKYKPAEDTQNVPYRGLEPAAQYRKEMEAELDRARITLVGMEHDPNRPRQQFSTGAVRDTQEGKVSFRLISPHLLAEWPFIVQRATSYPIADRGLPCGDPDLISSSQRAANAWQYLQAWRATLDTKWLLSVAACVVADLGEEEALRRLSDWSEKGGLRYGLRNWEAGMPITRIVDSCSRHVLKWWRGQEDEDHHAAVLWNVMAVLHYQREIAAGGLPAELDDMPRYGGSRAPREEVAI